VLGPGDLLGELSAVDAGPRSATVTAIDPVKAGIITGEGFRDFLAANPAASLLFLRAVSSRLRDSDRRRVEFVGLDTVGRVAGRLEELAREHGVGSAGGGTSIDLPLSQDELAGLTGASREADSRQGPATLSKPRVDYHRAALHQRGRPGQLGVTGDLNGTRRRQREPVKVHNATAHSPWPASRFRTTMNCDTTAANTVPTTTTEEGPESWSGRRLMTRYGR
jgi:hypothetical protein